MRISGGRARGIPLQVPRDGPVRPATDALRQAVFSSLAARVPGAHFLDLFAGSGAYGLEALSRGASGGVFVEANPRAAACLRRNRDAVGRSLGRDLREAPVIEADVLSALRSAALPSGIELVFVDPPYEALGELAEPVFASLARVLEPGSDPIVVLEMPGNVDVRPAGWTEVKRLGRPGGRQPTACIFRPAGAD